MTAPSVARPRGRPRFSGLAWRRARWGYVFIAPWIIGFLAFTLIPMIATFAFTFTNINLAQEEPLQFVGLKNYETLLNDRQTWDSLFVTLKFAALSLPVAVCLPFVVALMLHSRHLRRARSVPGLLLPALRRPVRGRRLHLGRDAEPRYGLDQRGHQGHRDQPSARLARRSGLDLRRTRDHGDLGDRRRDDRLPGRAEGHPDRALRGGPDRRRGGAGRPCATSRSR